MSLMIWFNHRCVSTALGIRRVKLFILDILVLVVLNNIIEMMSKALIACDFKGKLLLFTVTWCSAALFNSQSNVLLSVSSGTFQLLKGKPDS